MGEGDVCSWVDTLVALTLGPAAAGAEAGSSVVTVGTVIGACTCQRLVQYDARHCSLPSRKYTTVLLCQKRRQPRYAVG